MSIATKKIATILALATAVISGASNFINKFAVTAMKDPVFFTTLKNLIVACFLVGVLVVLKKWSEIRTLTSRQWFRLLAIGVVGGSVPFALFFTGLSLTSAINGALIHKTLVLWVILLAIPFLKERVRRWQWIGIGMVFAANLAVGGFTGFRYNAGELMIFGATILWAIENIIAKKTLTELSETVVAGARMVFGSLFLLVFLIVRDGTFPVSALTSTQWGWVVLTALLLFGYVTTWYSALKRAPVTYVATLLVPATLVTNVLSALFITRAFTVREFVIALFFLAGTAITIFAGRKNAIDHVAPSHVRAI